MRDIGVTQQLGQGFRLFDGSRAHQNGLALGIRFADCFDDRIVFLACRAIDRVILVQACNGAVGRHLDNTQTVNLGEFVGFGQGGTGHTCQLVVEAEIVLERHLREGHVLGLDLAAFFRLDRLMQTV